MAISDALNNEVTKTTEPAKANASQKRSEVFKNQGVAARAALTDDQKAAEGSKSATITFKGCLGNPARPQSRVQKGESVPSLTVVGYEFVSSEPITIDVLPIKEGFKSLSDVDYENASTKQVAAGEVFALNAMETAALISRSEYAGKFSGDGKDVTLSAKFANDRPDPLPILKTSEGSIKDVMNPVADMVEGKPVVKEQYAEKFAVLFARKKATKTGATKVAQAGEAEKNIAAAFRQFLDSKKTNA